LDYPLRFPDFLIVGAMKSGTTSLFRDLLLHPQVFFPEDKEPGNLIHDDVLKPQGRRYYASLFQKAHRDQICGDASTVYSQLPDLPGVAQRARQLLPDHCKVLYVVREPVSRIISQYHHDFNAAGYSEPIDEAIRCRSRLINYSRYAYQIEPWMAAFGRHAVEIIRFEDYIHDRRRTVEKISRFLGLEPHTHLLREDRVFNRSSDKPVAKDYWSVASGSPLYRRFIRPLIPLDLRQWISHLVLPRARMPMSVPSIQTVDYILDRVEDDAARLQELTGRTEPFWDLQSVRQSYASGVPRHY
jgi:hypothetical protein